MLISEIVQYATIYTVENVKKKKKIVLKRLSNSLLILIFKSLYNFCKTIYYYRKI